MAGNRRRNAISANDSQIDETDLRIVAEIQAEGRVTMAELGRRVGLSAPAVTERLQRLERRGVIRGYHADVDPTKLGLSLSAVIRIRPAPGQLQNVAAATAEAKEIVECHRITGEDCYILRAHVRDVEHLEELIDRFTPIGQTTTSIVQSSPVPKRGVALS
jgi:Lrp/AsnC family leucine-responsive transcriptional regulator